MRKIRTGDQVLVTNGRNKGQRGTVRQNLMERDRVVIEGVNIVKKHIKRGRARQAGIVEVEAALHVSNVMLVCPSCGEPSRVGVRTNDSGKNERYCKKCEAGIPRPTA
jgi:large subunit ribosomal protein L24